ncbi:hypothetical protein Ddc_11429 [Ditylenchus destructor]|nr:hypothetical protein Ddc_11429 [Ditylenchus destructor]
MAPSGEKRSALLSRWFQRFSGKSPSTSSYYSAEPPLGQSRSNRSENQNKQLKNEQWSDGDEQMRKTMCFAAVLIGNLVVLGCLLLAWNANAVSNRNIMWAVLIVGIASGLSFLCCALFFLLCFGTGDSMSNCFQMCCHSEDHKIPGTTYKKSTLIRKISGLGKKGKREGGRLYGIQTVCPTPEFQYFANTTMVFTAANTEMGNQTLDSRQPTTSTTATSGSLGERSNVSQSHLSAFSLISTAPASSPQPPAQLGTHSSDFRSHRGPSITSLQMPHMSQYTPSSGHSGSLPFAPLSHGDDTTLSSSIIRFPPPFPNLSTGDYSYSNIPAYSDQNLSIVSGV